MQISSTPSILIDSSLNPPRTNPAIPRMQKATVHTRAISVHIQDRLVKEDHSFGLHLLFFDIIYLRFCQAHAIPH